MEKRIIIAGSGGQGVLFLGKLIAYAGMLNGMEITFFPSYGAEMRGGTANCTVLMSDELIGSPVINNPDILVALNTASCERFNAKIREQGLLIYDSSLVHNVSFRPDIKNIGVPAGQMAASMSRPRSANMVIAGAFSAFAGLLPVESFINALTDITPERRKETIKTNTDLIMRGFHAGIN
ncbi:MAG: 2-oxoacid:ferredoxin oxidoreductase subunit gamma [Nitrospirae bacterium]|nr:MAG: 2-oxoacid:ferredoxin oxidoreductase subunit gamma [Nitrospirota bacterium]